MAAIVAFRNENSIYLARLLLLPVEVFKGGLDERIEDDFAVGMETR